MLRDQPALAEAAPPQSKRCKASLTFAELEAHFKSLDPRTLAAKERTKKTLRIMSKCPADLCYQYILRGVCDRSRCRRLHFCREGHLHPRGRSTCDLTPCEHLDAGAYTAAHDYLRWREQSKDAHGNIQRKFSSSPPPVFRERKLPTRLPKNHAPVDVAVGVEPAPVDVPVAVDELDRKHADESTNTADSSAGATKTEPVPARNPDDVTVNTQAPVSVAVDVPATATEKLPPPLPTYLMYLLFLLVALTLLLRNEGIVALGHGPPLFPIFASSK